MKTLHTVIVLVFFFFLVKTDLLSQNWIWYESEPTNPTYNLNADPSKVKFGLNKPNPSIDYPGFPTTDPLFIIHSFPEYEAETDVHPAILRLQTEMKKVINSELTSNVFGETRIEFWSNQYKSTPQDQEPKFPWEVARIQAINVAGEDEILDGSSNNFKGGLSFFSSGGNTYPETSMPIETFRIVEGNIGIFQHDLEDPNFNLRLPDAKLDVKGQIFKNGNN